MVDRTDINSEIVREWKMEIESNRKVKESNDRSVNDLSKGDCPIFLSNLKAGKEFRFFILG